MAINRSIRGRAWVLAFTVLPATAAAQHVQHAEPPAIGVHWGAQAIGLITHATPGEAGRDLTEGYVTQPNVFLHANVLRNRLRFTGTLNLEGLTLDRGELNAGTWGEGYIDRRHPHTFLHEAVISGVQRIGGTALSLSAGRGFAPFGTDDPMVRPFVKFPANHHLTQVLERQVLIGAVRYGPAILEAGLFNGNEPLQASDVGGLERFGDSWATRLTVLPTPGVELQLSRADITSPEQPLGGGLDQVKWSASARYDNGTVYGLLEWARTSEQRHGSELFALPTVLAEAAYYRDAWRFAVRGEHTRRVEEERSGNIFRSPWPHAEAHVYGFTNWRLYSASVARQITLGPLRAMPLIEVSHQRPQPTRRPALFDPAELYGSDRLWSLSFGVQLGAGMRHTRMGRYGVAVD